MTSQHDSILERESTQEFECDGRNISMRCLKFAKVRVCSGCNAILCANCFKDHKEDVMND